MSESEVTTCYRHQDRRSGVICQRCDRPICGDCMTQASVGFHCPECTRSGKQQVIRGPVGFDPLVTKGLIGITTAVSLAMLSWGGTLAGIQGRGFQESALIAPFVDDGEYHRILLSALTHDGLFHLALNMAALWFLGSPIERGFGWLRYIVLYLVSILGGAFAAMLFNPLAAGVGASGAVYGLLGAMIVAQKANGYSLRDSPLIPILGINLVLSIVVPQISLAAHVGGFVAGSAVTGIYLGLARTNSDPRAGAAAGALFGVFLFAASLWAAAQWLDPLF